MTAPVKPSSHGPEHPPLDQPSLVLRQVLRALRPLVRLLVRNGVTYTMLAAALKRLFFEAARHELARQQMPATDSAITLLSGVHRRDVRALGRPARDATAAGTGQGMAEAAALADAPAPPKSLPAEVVARWLSDPRFCQPDGRSRALARGAADADSFDALVASVSLDVRPRAVLDELRRLGVVEDTDDGAVQLSAQGFAPRQGLAALAGLMADNLHDHAAAAAANLMGDADHLEQALFVDQLAPASILALRQAARQAWQQAFKTVMATAQTRFDADQALPPGQRQQRARIGLYFYSSDEDPPDA